MTEAFGELFVSPKNGDCGIKRRGNNALNGGISVGHEVDRALELVELLIDFDAAQDINQLTYTADTYGDTNDESVSFENAQHRTLEIQERLDNEIIAENNNVDADNLRNKGLAPCQRVGLDD